MSEHMHSDALGPEINVLPGAGQQVPKLLHYIWIGGKPLPGQLQANVDKWRRLMPDFRIQRWDESNYDVHGHPWVAKMYAQGRYAFASDHMRLDVLHRFGGIYLDVDTALLKPLEPFLGDPLMVSFEFDSFLSTGIIASRKGHPFLLDWMALYDKLEGPVVSNDLITRYFLERFPEFHLNNREQLVGGDIRVLPKEYFAIPTHDRRMGFGINQSTNSWVEKRKKNIVSGVVRHVVGEVLFFKLVNVKMNWRSEYVAMDRARRK